MNEQRLRAFGAAWTNKDVDGLMSFMTDDCVYMASVGPEPGMTYRGPADVRRGFTEMLAFDSGLERREGAMTIVGDVGFAEWAFEERLPEGVRLVRGCDLFEFAGDLIRKKDAFRKVMGAVPRVEERRDEGG